MNELKIEIPSGMEIDKENSSFELIKFKPKLDSENFKKDFISLLESCTRIKFPDKDNFSRIELYNSDGEWLFDFDYSEENGIFYYSYYHVYDFFGKKYGYNYFEINKMLESLLEEVLKLKGKTTCRLAYPYL